MPDWHFGSFPNFPPMYHASSMMTYGPPPFDAVCGQGLYLYDAEGRKYLDFGSGIAVTSLGHSHPVWVEAVRQQAGMLAHCSNLYGIPEQKRLADRLVAEAGPGRVFFCNSGAEANEALIKLARLHGRQRADGDEGVCYTVVTAENAFHGRTFGGMAATPQEKVQAGFRPMLDGFRFARLNHIESFDALVDASVAAVFLESIQGEGGIFPAEPAFLRELRALCSERGVLLMMDEVQCGIGRTGRFFAYQKSGIRPDAIGMAKGLGAGFPIGAVWAGDSCAALFQPGSHGTTFGGSPLACAAAHAVLDVIERDQLLEAVAANSPAWHASLARLAANHPSRIASLRAEGYMVGLQLHCDPRAVAERAREHGLLIVPAGYQTIRLLPALIASPAQLSESVEILDRVFSSLKNA